MSGPPPTPSQEPRLRVVQVGLSDFVLSLRDREGVNLDLCESTIDAIAVVGQLSPPQAADAAHEHESLSVLLGDVDVPENDHAGFISAIKRLRPDARIYADIIDPSWPVELLDGVLADPADLLSIPRVTLPNADTLPEEQHNTAQQDALPTFTPHTFSPKTEPTTPSIQEPDAQQHEPLDFPQTHEPDANTGAPAAQEMLRDQSHLQHVAGGVAAEAILRGDHALPAVLDTLSGALGIGPLRVLKHGASPEPGHVSLPLHRRGSVVAHLSVPSTHKETIAAFADELAAWAAADQQAQQLRSAALHDPVTSAPNANAYTRAAAATIARAMPARSCVTVVSCQIEGWATWANRVDPKIADELACELVRALLLVVRQSDRVYRTQSHEFAIVLDHNQSERNAGSQLPTSFMPLAQRLSQTLTDAKAFPACNSQESSQLTVRGALACAPWDSTDASSLLTLARQRTLDSTLAAEVPLGQRG